MFTEHQFDTGTVSLNYAEGPRAGNPLLVLHGATSRWQDMLPILPTLAERWHVYAVDLRGHGQSGRVAGHYRLTDYVQDMIDFIQVVIGEPTAIYGHSLGGIVGLGVAAQQPDAARALVLEDPALIEYSPKREDSLAMAYFRGVYDTLTKTRSLEAILAWVKSINPAETAEDTLLPWAETLYQLDPEMLIPIIQDKMTVKGSLEPTLRRVQCPMLVLQADPALGAATEDEDVAMVKTCVPQAQIIRMTGAGHGIHHDQTAALLERVTAFLEGI